MGENSRRRSQRHRPPDDRAWADYTQAFRATILPALLESAYMVAVGESPDPDHLDLRAATEIGLMLMLDKPLLLVVLADQPVPAALIRAASAVVNVSGLMNAADREKVAAAARRMMEGL